MSSKKILKSYLTSPKIFFYSLIWLSILLFWGTIAQKYIGLYQAQEKYFSSMLAWIGPIPIPGGRLTLIVITLNLIFKLCFASSFQFKKLGILITHLGSLCLLLGGFLTAYFANEGNMVLNEGESASFYQDYHELELVLIDSNLPNSEPIEIFSQDEITKSKFLSTTQSNLKFEILGFHKNIALFPREEKPPASHKHLTQQYFIKSKPSEIEEELNRSGIVFKVTGLDEEQDGIYMSYEFMHQTPSLEINQNNILVVLRHKRYPLDFTVECIDVEKIDYPGTLMARECQSEVNVIRDDTKRNINISMNQPLRTDGYTFYQSNYINREGQETTVFAVVRNVGRLFPYISSIIICIGILIHLLIQLPSLLKKV